MALEDVVKGFERTVLTDRMHSIIEQNPHSAEGRMFYAEYLNKYGGITNLNDAQVGARAVNPTEIGFQVEKMRGESSRNLADVARANYKAVINELPSDELLNYALEISGAKITNSYLKKISQTKDPTILGQEYNKLRSLLLGKYIKEKDGKPVQNEYWAGIVATADPNYLLVLAQNYAEEEEEKLLVKHVGTKKKDKKTGKEEYILDENKLRAYVKTKIDGLKDNEKDNYCVNLAGRYANYKASKKD